MTVRGFLRQLLRDEAGQDLVEYALLSALLALGAILSMRSVTHAIVTFFSNLTTLALSRAYS